jgi:hypothetical protein
MNGIIQLPFKRTFANNMHPLTFLLRIIVTQQTGENITCAQKEAELTEHTKQLNIQTRKKKKINATTAN